MGAAAIAQLILLAGQTFGSILNLANQFKATASETDQATVDAALQNALSDANLSLSAVEADLDAASKT
jgi:hypothetical protein